ncbi:MAG TPA: hypothetical protein VM598_05285 [Bdellovibrionota bacterium]|nr:hypothetical protein [Bdellovibrionota bacterium]
MRFTPWLAAATVFVISVTATAIEPSGSQCDVFTRAAFETQYNPSAPMALDRAIRKLEARAFKRLPFLIGANGQVQIPTNYRADTVVTIPVKFEEEDFRELGLSPENEYAIRSQIRNMAYRIQLKWIQPFLFREASSKKKFQRRQVIESLQVLSPTYDGRPSGPLIQYRVLPSSTQAPIDDASIGSCVPAKVVRGPQFVAGMERTTAFDLDACRSKEQVFAGRTIRVGSRFRPIEECGTLPEGSASGSELEAACGAAFDVIGRTRWGRLREEQFYEDKPRAQRVANQVREWQRACSVEPVDRAQKVPPELQQKLRQVISSSVVKQQGASLSSAKVIAGQADIGSAEEAL